MSEHSDELTHREPDPDAPDRAFLDVHASLSRIDRRRRDRPQNYRASKEIIAAVNTAIKLGKPLLVSGDPGVGKTALARYIAWRLGLMRDGPFGPEPEVLRFDVKSTTKGADLIYRYDAIGHFREGQWEDQKNRKAAMHESYDRYIQLDALGTAIALGARRDDNGGIEGLEWETALGKVVRKALSNVPDSAVARTSVVLIDEIDKAPRDVPNDLLRELDDMVFEIPEIGSSATLPPPEVRPIVIITTNNARELPAAFLRRCCFLCIDFPEDFDAVREIIQSQLPDRWRTADIVGDAIRVVHALRRESPYKPATAELIEFILRLHSVDPDHRRRLRPLADGQPLHGDAQVAHTVFVKGREGADAIRSAFMYLKD